MIPDNIKQDIENEAKKLYPDHEFDTPTISAKRIGYIEAATRYAEKIEKLKQVIWDAWNQATENCEAENGITEEGQKYVSRKDFAIKHNL